MLRQASEALANRVLHYYKNVANRDSSMTWNHFKQEGFARSTIYRYIQKYGDSENVIFNKNPGKTPTVATSAKLRAIEKLFKENPSTSISAAAKKLNMTRSHLAKVKLQTLGIKAPQIRPIEKFWAICKQKYSKVKKIPQDVKEFTRIWSKIAKESPKRREKYLWRVHEKKWA